MKDLRARSEVNPLAIFSSSSVCQALVTVLTFTPAPCQAGAPGRFLPFLTTCPCCLPASPVQLSSQHHARAHHSLSALLPSSGHSGFRAMRNRLLSSPHADPSCGRVQTFPKTQAFQEEDTSHSQPPQSHPTLTSRSLDTA